MGNGISRESEVGMSAGQRVARQFIGGTHNEVSIFYLTAPMLSTSIQTIKPERFLSMIWELVRLILVLKRRI